MASQATARLGPHEVAFIRSHLEKDIEGLLAVYLFGSFANASARAGSDVDLGVLATNPVPTLKRLEIAEGLSSALGRDVDLVDLRSASAVLRSQVVARGHPILRRGERSVTAFEDFVFADYARLNEERAGILADIQARGSVHGG